LIDRGADIYEKKKKKKKKNENGCTLLALSLQAGEENLAKY